MTTINGSRCNMPGDVDGTAGARKVGGFADPGQILCAAPPGEHHALPAGADENADTVHDRNQGGTPARHGCHNECASQRPDESMTDDGAQRLARMATWLASVVFFITSLALTLISLALIAYSFLEIWQAFSTGTPVVGSLLHAVGLIVIAIAVFDVAKFLIEEEVVRHERELRSLREARQTLTKFVVIILIAIMLHGLVFIFEAGSEDITNLLYPAGLLLAGVLLLVGLGLYQRLSLETETKQAHSRIPDE